MGKQEDETEPQCYDKGKSTCGGIVRYSADLNIWECDKHFHERWDDKTDLVEPLDEQTEPE